MLITIADLSTAHKTPQIREAIRLRVFAAVLLVKKHLGRQHKIFKFWSAFVCSFEQSRSLSAWAEGVPQSTRAAQCLSGLKESALNNQFSNAADFAEVAWRDKGGSNARSAMPIGAQKGCSFARIMRRSCPAPHTTACQLEAEIVGGFGALPLLMHSTSGACSAGAALQSAVRRRKQR